MTVLHNNAKFYFDFGFAFYFTGRAFSALCCQDGR